MAELEMRHAELQKPISEAIRLPEETFNYFNYLNEVSENCHMENVPTVDCFDERKHDIIALSDYEHQFYEDIDECSSWSTDHDLERSNFVTELDKLTTSYKYVMEEFFTKMDKWVELRKKNIQNLKDAIQKFGLLKKTTAGITLASSTLEFLHKALGFSQNTKYSTFVQIVGGLSITCSFSALMYSSRTIEDLIKDIRGEKSMMRDMEMIYRRGNWIDKDVQNLFPHAIDMELVKKFVFGADGNLREPWKVHLFQAVMLSNTKEDRKLLNDEKFLVSSKEFVKSTVAQIWINRMKLRKLLDDMTRKLDDLPGKKGINGNGVFMNLAAINMYPIVCDMFWDSKMGFRETRIAWNVLAAIKTASSISENEERDFEDLKKAFEDMREDYKNIKKMTKNLVSDYD